jgi:hypothetical protein
MQSAYGFISFSDSKMAMSVMDNDLMKQRTKKGTNRGAEKDEKLMDVGRGERKALRK